MLKSARVGEWRVLCEAERAEALLRLFERLVSDDWTGVERLEFASTTGRVFKIRTAAGTFVFKHERREHHSADHRWQSFFFGSNTRRLIRALDRAGARNFPAAEVFLAAPEFAYARREETLNAERDGVHPKFSVVVGMAELFRRAREEALRRAAEQSFWTRLRRALFSH